MVNPALYSHENRDCPSAERFSVLIIIITVTVSIKVSLSQGDLVGQISTTSFSKWIRLRDCNGFTLKIWKIR